MQGQKLEKDITQQHETSNNTYRIKTWSSFPIKDQTIFEHKHGIIHYRNCPAENCVDDCIGEAAHTNN